MNIAERRIPQDGRIVKQFGEKHVDMRVSSLPTHHGESIVLRVLDRSSVNLSLENLGLTDHIYNYITDTIEKPNGIFIVTGPTGAGKTTTLYAALRRINTIDAKLLTAEDPFIIDDEVRSMINTGLTTTQLRRRARELGMRTLREDGIRKVLSGLTSGSEVVHATMSDLD